MPDIEEMELVEELYEHLAHAIEDVRHGLGRDDARETENKFLAKLAFLALRQLADPAQQQALIAAAMADFAENGIRRH